MLSDLIPKILSFGTFTGLFLIPMFFLPFLGSSWEWGVNPSSVILLDPSEMGRGLAVSLLTSVVFSYTQCPQFFSQTLHDLCRLPQELNCIQVENVILGFGGTSFNPLFGFVSSAAEGWVQVSIYEHCAPQLVLGAGHTAAALGLPVWLWFVAWQAQVLPLARAALHVPAQCGQLYLCSQGNWGCCDLW